MEQKPTPLYSVVGSALILVAFGVLCGYMVHYGYDLGKDSDSKWDHLLVVFNAIQAIAAAAAGALLGTTVQQARVATAEAKVKKAEDQAQENQVDANKAKAARAFLSGQHGLQPPGSQANPLLDALKAVLN